MPRFQSKVTKQNRVTLPIEIRRALGLSAGSVIEWERDGDAGVVRRVGGYSSEDIHRVLFANRPKPTPRTLEELKEGIATYIREKHARD
jgi:AbrB family looped-hinge helix DNA binding protein